MFTALTWTKMPVALSIFVIVLATLTLQGAKISTPLVNIVGIFLNNKAKHLEQGFYYSIVIDKSTKNISQIFLSWLPWHHKEPR
jgi:hypothetical protein